MYQIKILSYVHQALTESVLTFNIVSWFGHLYVLSHAKLSTVVNQGTKSQL